MRRTVPLIATAAVLALTACGGQPQEQAHGGGMPPPMVGVAAPLKRELPVIREVTGQVEAIEYVELRPQVSGLVERVLAKDGAELKAGDVVLDIDRKPLEVALRTADANRAHADVLLLQAKQQLARAVELRPQGISTQQQVDDLTAAEKAAEAQLAANEAALAQAKLDLGYAHVTSPIAGRIGKVQQTAGNLVQGGGPVPATLLATIVSMDPIDIAFDVDEDTWREIAPRVHAAETGGKPVPVSAAIAGDQGFPRQGVIAFADNRVDPATSAIRVRGRFANPDRAITPGSFARVRIEVTPPRPVLLINEQALQSKLAMRYVLVVTDDGKTGFRPLQLGEAVDGGLRVVTGGLGPDEKLVVSGLGKVFYPGMQVQPTPTSMEHPVDAGAPAGGPPGGAPGGAGGPGGKPADSGGPPAGDAKPGDAKPGDAKPQPVPAEDDGQKPAHDAKQPAAKP
jgi:RND family efflux transporter MFP subunit